MSKSDDPAHVLWNGCSLLIQTLLLVFHLLSSLDFFIDWDVFTVSAVVGRHKWRSVLLR